MIQKKELLQLGQLQTRMVKYELSTGTTEWLITNLNQEEITGKELGEMYFKRWGIELGFEILKNKLEIENVSGKTRLAVEQDFYASILAFNMLEDLKNDANREVTRNKENGCKYDYQVNINILAGLLKICMISIALNEDNAEKLYQKMMRQIKRSLVAIRPNRQYQRKKKKSENKYKTNLRRNC